MLSRSRFADQLIAVGALSVERPSTSPPKIHIRDPGGNLIDGFRPTLEVEERPLTKALRGAMRRDTGSDVEGYRDYRGVMVVGAWTWLDDYDLGIVTEIDYEEAFEPLEHLNQAFQVCYGFLALGITTFAVSVMRMARRRGRARDRFG